MLKWSPSHRKANGLTTPRQSVAEGALSLHSIEEIDIDDGALKIVLSWDSVVFD